MKLVHSEIGKAFRRVLLSTMHQITTFKSHSKINQEGKESPINLLSANNNQNHLYGVVT